MDDLLQEYLESHTTAAPGYLDELYRQVHLQLLYPRMCSGHLQGRVLTMLTSMIRPRRALEIGTYAGYSALCIAEGLPDDGARLHTIEIDDEMEPFIRRQLARTPLGRRVELHIGDAAEVLPEISDEPFDMAYIDGNKRTYLQTYEQVLAVMRPGSFIIADNTLWSGKVLEAAGAGHTDAQTRGIMEFNDFVAHDSRVSAVMLPLRDGLTLLRVENR